MGDTIPGDYIAGFVDREALSILWKNKQPSRISGERGFRKIDWRKEDVDRLKNIHEEMKNFKSRRSPWRWLQES